MNNVGTAYVEVKPDLSGFSREVKGQIAGAQSGLKSQMASFAKTAGPALAAGAAVGLGVLAKNAISAASDINESLSKNAKLFGKYSKGVEDFASTSAKSYGISKKAALEYTGVFGNLFRALGQSEKAASGNSVQLTKLAADMASFNNTSVEDALEAIRSGLVGETEPLRKFGVNMNDTTLKVEALALAKKGLISMAEATAKTLSPETKAMAAQSLIMKQTSQSHGDFADTSSSLANQQKILKARLDDASAAIGARLLPFAVKGANALNDLLTAAQNGTGVFGAIKGIWDGVAGAFSGGGDSGGKLKGIIDSLVSSSQGLVDIGVALWERFGGVLTAQGENLIRTWGAVLSGITTALKGLIEFVAGVFTGDWDRAWDGIKLIFEGVWKAMLGTVTYTLNTLKNVANLALIALAAIVKGVWAGIKGLTIAAWNGIRDAVLIPIRFARDQMEAIGAGIANRLSTAWTTVKTAAITAWTAVRDTVLDAVRGARDAVPDILTGIANRVASGWKSILGGARDFASDVKDAIVGAFKGAADKVFGFVKAIVGVINKIPGIPDIKLAEGGKVSAAGVDQALATGGQIRRGTKLTHPTVLMGEEAPCIAEGTLIETAAGPRSIESVAAGERVLTRNGYREVLWSGITRRDAEVLCVTSVSGDNVLCTPDHRIWTASGDDDGDGRRDCMGGRALRGRGVLPVHLTSTREETSRVPGVADDGPRHDSAIPGCGRIWQGPRSDRARPGAEADLRGGHRGPAGRAKDHHRVPAVAGRAPAGEGTGPAGAPMQAGRGSGGAAGVLQARAPSHAGERLHDAERLRSLSDLQAGRGTRVDAREAADGPGVRAAATRGVPGLRSAEARWREARELTVGDWIWTLAADGELRATRIASIAPADRIDTYDLVVDQDHEFVAGGILVHNSHPEYVIPTNPAYRQRAMNLTAGLLQDLGVPLEARTGGVIGLAKGGVLGVLGDVGKTVGGVAKGILDLPLGLIEKGASWILDQLPNPADMLPDWLTGLGKYAITRVTSWVKDKVTGLLGSSEGGVGGGGGIVALGRRLQRMGYAVSENPAFGGVHAVHAPNSYHYKGRALDVNADNFPGGEPAALDRLYAMLRKLPGVVELLWRVAGHYDHLHVAMAQGGILGGPKVMQAPFVGSYKNGGVIPRDGLAYVHQGETITPAGGIGEVRIFVGDREIKDIVRVEVDENRRQSGAMYRAGVLA